MTKEEILEMKMGRELNIRVAEDVMGCKFAQDDFWGDMQGCIDKEGSTVWGPLEPYSEDRSIAQEVVDKLENNYDVRFELNYYMENWEAEFRELGTGLSFGMVSALDAPEAICKAALLAILGKEG